MSFDQKLSKIYYSVDGYYKGYSTISKLAKKANVSEAEAKSWLTKQKLWQVYLPPPTYIPRPHWIVDKPNMIHQADLLFLPHDVVRQKIFKYALVVVDVVCIFHLMGKFDYIFGSKNVVCTIKSNE